MKVVMDQCRGKGTPLVPASVHRYCTGQVMVANTPVSLGISAESVVTLPIHMKDTVSEGLRAETQDSTLTHSPPSSPPRLSSTTL